MRILAAALFALVGALAMGQGYNQRYDAFDQGRPQDAWGVERTSDGFTVISGSYDADSISPDSSFFHVSTLFTFLDADGVKISEHRNFLPWRGTYPGWANCCDTIPGGGYVVGGGVQSEVPVNEVCLLRIDPQGDTLWTRVFGGTNQYWIGRQVKRTPDGGFLIVGDTDASGYVDGFALKTDSLGNEQWRHTYGWSSSQIDGLLSCDLGPANTFYLGGTRVYSSTNTDHWIQRVDTSGALLWRVSWGGIWDDGSAQFASLSDGQVLVASGIGYAADGTAMRPYMAKLDSLDGSIIWEHEYGAIANSTLLFAAKECPNGDLIACGVSYASGDQQGLLLRTTSEGDSVWMRTYYYQDTLITTGQGRFYDVLPTDDGGFIAAGSAYNPAGGPYPPGYSQDTWVVKVDSMGCIVPGCDGVGVQEVVTNLGSALTVYPNPVAANGQLTVELSLPASMHLSAPLRLVLTSVQGQLVKELALPTQHDQRVMLDMGGLGAGLYSVHVADGGRWLTGARLVVSPP